MGRPARKTFVLATLAIALGGLALAGFALADRYDTLLPEKPQRYVTDRAGVFAPGQAEQLNAKLEQFERDTSDQILVWIDKKVPEGFTLEDFTVRTAQKWGPGGKKLDRGIVLFVFPEDHKARIEVGYGLEGALPDVTANRILQDEMFPSFRSGDYAAGIVAGADAIMAAARGEYTGSGRTRAEREGRRGSGSGIRSASTCLLVLIFFVFPLFFRSRRRWRTFGGGGWWGGGGWGGGWGGGGFGGGGGGGFSGGGGGFSGGGGSFGGGGASGSW